MGDRLGRTGVAVAICTYKRNEELGVLLRALIACAERVKDRAAVGVAIVDDTAEGLARPVADSFAGTFELGLSYAVSGRQNISLARNAAIGAAMDMADWTAMTDDDCEPPAEWLEALLDAQARTDADCVTGRMIRRAPPGSPKWLATEPFFDLAVEHPADGAPMTSAATSNSMLRSAWLRDHADIRFDPAFGTIGGEDMVFYRAAHAAGLRIHYAADAFTWENEPPARATFGYQLHRFFWQGNNVYHSGVGSGIPRWRMTVHGVASLARALRRPVARAVTGRSPQLRFGLANVLHAAGQLVGPLGVRVDHR